MQGETSEIEYPISNTEYPTDQVWEHLPWILDIPCWLLDIEVTANKGGGGTGTRTPDTRIMIPLRLLILQALTSQW